MRRLPLLIAIAAVLAVLGGAPTAAQAGGCPSEQSVMTSSSSSQYVKSGYICAQEDHSGEMSIGAGKTHSWNDATNADYFPWYYCYNTSSSSVTVAHGQTWGSVSYTATNWLTPSNTRDWAVGVLWTLENVTPSGFSGGCTYKGSTTWNHPPAILRISSISYSGIPTSAVAGTAYPITVTVSPSSATGTVAIQDGGVSVASASLSGGTATINWIPAVDGTSSLVVVYAGDSADTPAKSASTSVPVSGGVSVAVTGAGPSGATVSVSPATQTGNVALVNASAGKALVGMAPLSATGTTTFPMSYAANTKGSYVAIVTNPAGAVVGQSYPYAWDSTGASPTSRTTTIGLTGVPTGGATAGKVYPIGVSLTPGSATGTVVLKDGATAIASATLSNGTATLPWTPAVDGTSKLSVLYTGDASTPAAATAATSVGVTGGTGLAITGVATASSTTAQATVAVTPTTTAGTVVLINAATQTAIGQGAIASGTATVSFPFTAGTTYKLVAKYQSATTPGQSYPVTWNSVTGFSARAARVGTTLRGRTPVAPERGVDPGVAVAQRASIGSRPFGIRCGKGLRLINADAMTSGPVDDVGVGSYSATGVRISPSPSDAGHRVVAQLICRPANADVAANGAVVYGTIRRNRIDLKGASRIAFGGPGPDLLTTRVSGSALWGGLGHDVMIVDGASAVADGGPGSDVIIGAGGSRHLLVGGRGHDSITSSFGPDLINVRDGESGDVVTCRDARVRVIADAGDVLSGPCLEVDAG